MIDILAILAFAIACHASVQASRLERRLKELEDAKVAIKTRTATSRPFFMAPRLCGGGGKASGKFPDAHRARDR